MIDIPSLLHRFTRCRPGWLRAGLVPLILTFLLTIGCESGPGLHPVSPDKAKQTLVVVLDGWKEGKPIDAWQKESPEIVVQDVDWSAGAKLVSYEIVGDGEPIDANLHCQVKLVLDLAGKPTSKTVTYLVGTSPVITVFRKLGP